MIIIFGIMANTSLFVSSIIIKTAIPTDINY